MDLPGILIGRRLANQEGEARKITVSNGKQSGPRIGMGSLASGVLSGSISAASRCLTNDGVPLPTSG
jgi:hypothetical protein